MLKFVVLLMPLLAVVLPARAQSTYLRDYVLSCQTQPYIQRKVDCACLERTAQELLPTKGQIGAAKLAEAACPNKAGIFEFTQRDCVAQPHKWVPRGIAAPAFCECFARETVAGYVQHAGAAHTADTGPSITSRARAACEQSVREPAPRAGGPDLSGTWVLELRGGRYVLEAPADKTSEARLDDARMVRMFNVTGERASGTSPWPHLNLQWYVDPQDNSFRIRGESFRCEAPATQLDRFAGICSPGAGHPFVLARHTGERMAVQAPTPAAPAAPAILTPTEEELSPRGTLARMSVGSTRAMSTAAAVLKLGRELWRTGNFEAAGAVYAQVIRRFPGTPEAVQASGGLQAVRDRQSKMDRGLSVECKAAQQAGVTDFCARRCGTAASPLPHILGQGTVPAQESMRCMEQCTAACQS